MFDNNMLDYFNKFKDNHNKLLSYCPKTLNLFTYNIKIVVNSI